jgi:hypothetical protein
VVRAAQAVPEAPVVQAERWTALVRAALEAQVELAVREEPVARWTTRRSAAQVEPEAPAVLVALVALV